LLPLQSAVRPFVFAQRSFRFRIPSLVEMAPLQSITMLNLLPWSCSTVTRLMLGELVNSGQLAPNVDR
jgi:hypothetical protein